ncbi:MAG: hypothetical protein GY722_18175 [bacterium]|nr:hypothetical protein [bacterium]
MLTSVPVSSSIGTSVTSRLRTETRRVILATLLGQIGAVDQAELTVFHISFKSHDTLSLNSERAES